MQPNAPCLHRKHPEQRGGQGDCTNIQQLFFCCLKLLFLVLLLGFVNDLLNSTMGRVIVVGFHVDVVVVIVTVVVFISSDYIAQVVPRAWLNSLTSTCSSLGLLLHCDGDDDNHFIMNMMVMVMMSVLMMMIMMMFMRCTAAPLLNSPWHRPRSASRRIQLVHTLSQVG